MVKEIIAVMIEGGKATAAPPLGPALGPLGLNIGQIVADINKKTASFNGMQVPIKVIVDMGTKEYKIKVGTPPVSSLVLKEAKVEKGSGNPNTDHVADVKIEQIIKVTKMKEDSLMGKTMVEKVKEVIGTCQSMGILVEGKPAHDTILAIDKGAFAKEIAEEKTEISAAEVKELEEERKRLQGEIEERREEFLANAKAIIDRMKGKERGVIKGKLTEAEIPIEIINELLPIEEAKPAVGAAAPAAGEEKPAEKKDGQ